jgi:tetratricopeptide (TPR) repeat protein
LVSLAAVGVLLWRRGAALPRGQRGWGTIAVPVLGIAGAATMLWLASGGLYADIYLRSAEAAATANRWQEALAFYQQAANTAPSTDLYHQELGEGYVAAAMSVDPSQRDALFQAAEQAFRRALETNPVDGTHRFNLAHLYLLWSQSSADPTRQATLLEQAARAYTQAAELMPHDPRVLNEWGLVLQAQGQPEAAIDKYRSALDVDPRDAEAYLHLGGVYQRSGKTDLALEMYQQANEVDPDLPEAHLALADLYRQEGRLMDAVAEQQRAAQLWPTDYRIHQNLALLYRDAGQIQNAIAEAERALNYAPPERREALQNFVQSLLASANP